MTLPHPRGLHSSWGGCFLGGVCFSVSPPTSACLGKEILGLGGGEWAVGFLGTGLAPLAQSHFPRCK